MPTTRRTVRKQSGPPASPPDERAWPVQLALLVLGVSLIIASALYLDFQDRRWYANAWFAIAAIVPLISLCMLAVAWWGGRRIRRSVQLGAVLSVLIHFVLVLLSPQVVLFTQSWMDVDRQPRAREPEEIVTVPDYQTYQLDPEQFEQQDFQRPVETETAQSEVQVQRSATAPELVARNPQPVPVTEPQPTPRPSEIERQERSETTPRRSDQLSQLSRQQLAAQPTVPPQVENVPAPSSSKQTPTPLTARATEIPRQPSTPSELTRASSEPSVTTAPQPAAPLVHRTAPSNAPAAAAPPPLVARRSSPDAPQATSTAEPTAAPQAEALAGQPVLEPRATMPVGRSAAPPAAAQPQAANAPSAELSAPSSAAQRAAARSVPEIAASASPATRPNNRAPEADLQAAQLPVSSPDASSSRAVSLAPSPVALDRAQAEGIAGSGRASGIGAAEPAPATTNLIASDAARRNQATQTLPELPQVAASERAIQPQRRADSPQPRSRLEAQPIPSAQLAGTLRPDPLDASASAALERRAASRPTGTITAERGAADVDLGAPQVVSSTPGTLRAEGGGRPELQPTGSTITRSATANPPGSSQVAAAPVAEAPGGDPSAAPTLAATGVTAQRQQASASTGAERAAAAPDASLPVEVASPSTRREPIEGPVGANTVAALPPTRRAASVPLETTGEVTPVEVPDAAPSANPSPSHLADRATIGRQAPGAGQIRESRSLGPAEPLDEEASMSDVALQRTAGTPGGMPTLGELATNAPRPDRSVPLPPGAQPGRVAIPELAGDAPDVSPAEQLAAVRTDQTRNLPDPAVRVDAPEGPGGLGLQLQLDAGLASRRAQRESPEITDRAVRFLRNDVGGPPRTTATAALPTPSFQRRIDRTTGAGQDQPGRPGPQTEQAIELGLMFLARQQQPDGNWTLRGYDEEVALQSDTAATGLALLAFQGAGYHHRDHRYAEVVRRGLEFLVRNQQPNGDLFVPADETSNRSVWLYSHSIAALALTEAYGMTQDPALRDPAQLALNFIIAAQHETRGGWRYAPAHGSDTSVSGWMVMALKSGQLSGLEVPDDVYRGVRTWLDLAKLSDARPYLYRYNPYAPNTPSQVHGRLPTASMTAVGLLMRLYTGWNRDNPNMALGANHLAQNLPSLEDQFARDTYYWYYATQVMFHMGGDYWRVWHERLHPLLVRTQVQEGPLAGSWDPRLPVPDRWGPHAGRLYVTTMNLLSLEVYYRHLPLYDETAR